MTHNVLLAFSVKPSLYSHGGGRQRGGTSSGQKKRGVSDNKVAVIATAGRQGGISLGVATMVRIAKEDISCSISGALPEGTILSTDGHVSYK